MMDKQAKDKIIQIISAPGNLWAETRDDNGNWRDLKVVAMALTESGRIWPMVVLAGNFSRADRPYIQRGPRHPY